MVALHRLIPSASPPAIGMADFRFVFGGAGASVSAPAHWAAHAGESAGVFAYVRVRPVAAGRCGSRIGAARRPVA